MKIKSIPALFNPNHNAAKTAGLAERVSAISHSSDAVGWRPAAYEHPARMEQFTANAESDITSLIESAHPDMYNAHFYGEIAATENALAKSELASQTIEHKRLIHLIHIYQEASVLDLEQNIARLEEELAKEENNHE